MHEAGQRAVGVVADRIGALVVERCEFARIRQELPRDRVGGIAWIDERGDFRVTATL